MAVSEGSNLVLKTCYFFGENANKMLCFLPCVAAMSRRQINKNL